ncbi:ribonuclease H-like domain-containing protein [Tanacetum coccineum]
MVTRFRVGSNRPTERLNLHVSSISPLPKSYTFNDPNWQNAMNDEYDALIKNNTWTLVPRPTDANIVCCMWLFCHKYLAYGTLSRYKALLMANGSMQLESVDVDETFSLFIGTSRPIGLGFSSLQLILLVLGLLSIRIISSLHQEFPMTDLGSLNYFLGIFVARDSSGMFLSQRKYAAEILEGAHMENCNLNRTPVDIESKLRDDGDLVSDPTLYRSLTGALQYLTFTRPDISYAVQQVCLHMHDPHELHFSALKRILCAKAEYRGVVNVVAETCWLRNLLCELHTHLSSATLVYCDNVSAVYLSSNPVQHQRTKHIEIDIHFVRDLVDAGQVRVLHVPTRYQYADIFIRGLPSNWFEEFRTSLRVRCSPAPTAKEC